MFKKHVLYLSLIALGFIGCGGKEGGSPSNHGLSTKNNVVWWQLADATNLIPGLNHDATASYVAAYIWEPLNGSEARTNELVPGLASLPEISEDHLTYTYTINPKAKFSDGKPLTGDDVVFSFKTTMNPAQVETSSLKNYLNSVDSISYVGGDKMKIAFHIHEPYFQNDKVLGGGYVKIMPKHIFDPNGLCDQMSWSDIKSNNPAKAKLFKEQAEYFASPEKARDPKYLIGSGAYLFSEWKTNDRITLKRDPNYWGKDVPWSEAYPDEVVFKTITDNNAALTALKSKDIDIMDNVPSPLFVQLDTAKQPFIKKDTVYYNSRVFIEWNGKHQIFSDKRVRWAMAYLVNREVIIKEVMKGLARPVNSPINFTQPFHDASLQTIPFDPEKSKQLLAEAGWSDSDGDGILDKTINGKKVPFEFTFMNNSGSDIIKQITLILSEQMKKVGIRANITSVEWSLWIENTRSQKYDAAIANMLGNASEDDPYQLWHSSQAKNKGSNVYSFINAEADKLLEMNRIEFDKAKRGEYMKRFQQIVYDEQPITFLWSSPLRLAYLDRFDNVEFFSQRPCFNLPFWIVRGSGVKALPNAPSTVKILQ
jgi:peptide/nickel transport system substrate-binding protein